MIIYIEVVYSMIMIHHAVQKDYFIKQHSFVSKTINVFKNIFYIISNDNNNIFWTSSQNY